FSVMVNYHALGRYITDQEGVFLTTTQRPTSLGICAALLVAHPSDYPETRQAYLLSVEQGGPDDFYLIKQALEQHAADLTLPQIVSYLRLSGWDSTLFISAMPALLERLKDAPDELKIEVYWATEQIWQLYYHIGEEQDL